MELIINRVLFSLYCWENATSAFLENYVFKSLFVHFCKLLYRYDPFGNIRKNNNSLDGYIKHTFRRSKEASENEDYGFSISKSQGVLCTVLFPFVLFVFFLIDHYFHISLALNIVPIQIFIIVSSALSCFICYIYSFKDDKYKSYFTTFRKSKCNNKWHIMTAGICCFAIIVFLFSIKFWFDCCYK